jgi:hypothetical protein
MSWPMWPMKGNIFPWFYFLHVQVASRQDCELDELGIELRAWIVQEYLVQIGFVKLSMWCNTRKVLSLHVGGSSTRLICEQCLNCDFSPVIKSNSLVGYHHTTDIMWEVLHKQLKRLHFRAFVVLNRDKTDSLITLNCLVNVTHSCQSDQPVRKSFAYCWLLCGHIVCIVIKQRVKYFIAAFTKRRCSSHMCCATDKIIIKFITNVQMRNTG